MWSRFLSRQRPTSFLVVCFLVFWWTHSKPVLGQDLQPDDQKNTIRGIVVNAVTHEPIGRALVSGSGDQSAMLTDAEGHFELTLPKADNRTGAGTGIASPRRTRSGQGALLLTARKPGFLDRPNEAGQAQALPGSEVTISLIPEALIKGRVIVSTGDAAEGIEVQIFSRQLQEGAPRWVLGAQARANSNGEFRFAELSPGPYKLVTRELRDDDPADTVAGGQAYGFAPVYYPGVPDFASAATIQLAAGQSFQAELSLVRQAYFPVKIPLANAESNGGLKIIVSVQGHRGPEYSLTYNAGKKIIEGLLPNGNYVVEAATLGQNSARGAVNATGAVNLAVAGAPVEGPSLALLQNTSVHLRVTEEFSDAHAGVTGSGSDGTHSFPTYGPRAYLQVRAEAADDFAPQRNASLRPPMGPGDDLLVIDDLAPGRYWLRLNSSRGYVAAATMGGLDVLRQPFTVVPGPSTPIEITMRDDSAQLDGTVAEVAAAATSYPGASPPPAFVYCVPAPESAGQFQQLGVAADGSFHSPAMTPGTYRVMAFKTAQTNLPYRDLEAMRTYESTGQVVHLGAGQKTSVQLQMASSE